jgi:hypothetical protein
MTARFQNPIFSDDTNASDPEHGFGRMSLFALTAAPQATT